MACISTKAFEEKANKYKRWKHVFKKECIRNINNAESIPAKGGITDWSMRTILDQNNSFWLGSQSIILIFIWWGSGKGFLKSFAHRFWFIGFHQWITPHTI